MNEDSNSLFISMRAFWDHFSVEHANAQKGNKSAAARARRAAANLGKLLKPYRAASVAETK